MAWRRVSWMRWEDHCCGKSRGCTRIMERSGAGVSRISFHGCGALAMRCPRSPILKHVYLISLMCPFQEDATEDELP